MCLHLVMTCWNRINSHIATCKFRSRFGTGNLKRRDQNVSRIEISNLMRILLRACFVSRHDLRSAEQSFLFRLVSGSGSIRVDSDRAENCKTYFSRFQMSNSMCNLLHRVLSSTCLRVRIDAHIAILNLRRLSPSWPSTKVKGTTQFQQIWNFEFDL